MSMVMEEGQGQRQESNSKNCNDVVVDHDGTNDITIEEEELAMLALVEHRTRDVKKIHFFVSHYTTKLEEAEMRLKDSETKLARIRAKKIADQNQTNADQTDASQTSAVQTNVSKTNAGSGAGLLDGGADQTVTTELGSNGGTVFDGNGEGSSRNQRQAKDRPKLVIPDVMPVMGFLRSRSPAQRRRLHIETENTEAKVQGTKRKFEEKEHKPLIHLVRKSSLPGSVNYRTSKLILSQHKRKVRTLALSPANDQLFVTSALDGVVNLWEVRSGGSDASLLSTTDCVTPMKRRWPEEIAWHPDGNKLFSVHSADGQDAQVSIMNLIRGEGGKREVQVNFLEDRPHVKGVINSIAFLPWEVTTFVTSGTDHAVIIWREDRDNKWTPKPLHRNLHTSAVMGVCGVQQKQIVLSVGKDKRVLGYNAHVGRKDFTHQVDARCLGILPNPCDFNLFVVQTGTPERQLRLFDIRSRRKEIHDFGWKQESSETQSALINPSWSPNGLYMTSGSADPVIHIYDIRYNGHKPCRSIEAHQKRVFKAAWLHSLPFLISISSDLNLGLHMVM